MEQAPTLAEIRTVRNRLDPYIIETPTVPFVSPYAQRYVDCEMVAKLELFQRTGTFKARGAINNILAIDDESPRVTAVSAGNHAIAVAYAAQVVGGDAKVVMQASANPVRVSLAEAFGAEIVIAPDGKPAFDKVAEIEKTENRVFIHPFEGKRVAEGTGGVGLELMEQDVSLDAVIVAVGGGGLAGGVASAVKQLNSNCAVYGVEPEGAAAMTRSFAKGEAVTLDAVNTIADSLGPPMATPYALSVCRKHLDDLVTVTDEEIAAAAAILFSDLKLAVEPAGAAALAGALGPLKEKLGGRRVGLIICGANIDRAAFSSLIERGQIALNSGVFTV